MQFAKRTVSCDRPYITRPSLTLHNNNHSLQQFMQRNYNDRRSEDVFDLYLHFFTSSVSAMQLQRFEADHQWLTAREP
jgi:hypothetical protein